MTLQAKFIIPETLTVNTDEIANYIKRITNAVVNMKLRSTCKEKLVVSLSQIYEMIMRDFRAFFAGFEKYVNWKRLEASAMRLVTL